jgi:hypothetical protein
LPLIKDLSKFYNCVSTDSTAQHMRRVLWRGGDPEAVPKIYITTTVNFGDKPAGCIAIAAVRETAERFGGESPAAWFLKNRTYVDDCTATSDSMADLENISLDLERIVSFGGFKFKETNMSGDPLSEEGAIKVLGLIWDTENDTLKVDCRVNFAGKRGGAKLGPDMDLDMEEEEFDENFPSLITKRIIWRVAQAQYDPLGLLAPYMIRLKMVMRDLCSEEGKVSGWDEPAPESVVEKFKVVVMGLSKIREISFPRTIKPAGLVSRAPMLMIFGDGSREAYCAIAYVRWELDDGTVQCRFITSKTRVTPKKVISIPRVELMGSLLAVRLATKIVDTFQFKFDKVKYFTDSSCVLGMLGCDSNTFTEFVANRVSEVRSKTSTDDWAWVPTDCNPADLGTRAQVTAADLAEGTWYQEGMDWMRLPEAEWPTKKTFKTQPPQEERRKGTYQVNAAQVEKKTPPVRPESDFTKVSKTIRIKATVMKAVRIWKEHKKIQVKTDAIQLLKSGKYVNHLEPDLLLVAERHLIAEAQVNVDLKDIASLLPEKCTFPGFAGNPVPIILVGGRSKARFRIGYDQDGVPVLPYGSPLALQYLVEAHHLDHGGVNNMLMRSRNYVWIVRGARMAEWVRKRCYKCRLTEMWRLLSP